MSPSFDAFFHVYPIHRFTAYVHLVLFKNAVPSSFRTSRQNFDMSDYLLQGNFWRGLFGGDSGSPNKLNSERRAFSNVCSLHSCAQGQYQDEIVSGVRALMCVTRAWTCVRCPQLR
ncbi:hypothetical protein COCCADRAFT_83167 [Bipolaris zeicola 26-R-13]|uniref:Uncharacterized protein n=1 Tax=Cochliobolus carbonum (strain 26-R-13) TaxID=930089 RepID=W6YKV6_COCC2|nr:uncharacterized protein COCCADRAFT_83167 [Bipolaris zeicola 26-R-13]EUC38370.1 hypothetical protein COCCADRAFT_83167 [Bipolaris zeicola 26-R-13]